MNNQTINIYCDESCHLEANDEMQKSMVLGAVWCIAEERKKIYEDIRSIKIKHSFSKDFEIKWTKVSPKKIDFYLELIEYFFSNENLNFRGLVIPDKTILNHETFGQTHDDWYYKMYFGMILTILRPNKYNYNIFIDIKDTKGGPKVSRLHDMLSNKIYDFEKEIIKSIEQVHSHEVEILQLTDLFIGALSYLFRGLETSSAKMEIIKKIKEKSGYSLKKNTLPGAEKFNLFIWQPKGEK